MSIAPEVNLDPGSSPDSLVNSLEPEKVATEITFSNWENESLPWDGIKGKLSHNRKLDGIREHAETRLKTNPFSGMPDSMQIVFRYSYDLTANRPNYQMERDYEKGWVESIQIGVIINEPLSTTTKENREAYQPIVVSIPLATNNSRSAVALAIRDYQRSKKGFAGKTLSVRLGTRTASDFDDAQGGFLGFLRTKAAEYKDYRMGDYYSPTEYQQEADTGMIYDQAIHDLADAFETVLSSLSLHVQNKIETIRTDFADNADLLALVDRSNPLFKKDDEEEGISPTDLIFSTLSGPYAEMIAAMSAPIQPNKVITVNEPGFYLYPHEILTKSLYDRRNLGNPPFSVAHELAMNLSSAVNERVMRHLDSAYWAKFFDASLDLTDLWNQDGFENPFGRVVIAYYDYLKRRFTQDAEVSGLRVAEIVGKYQHIDYLSPFLSMIMAQKLFERTNSKDPLQRYELFRAHIVPLLNGIRALQSRYFSMDENNYPRVMDSGNNQLVISLVKEQIKKRKLNIRGRELMYIVEMMNIDRDYANQVLAAAEHFTHDSEEDGDQ